MPNIISLDTETSGLDLYHSARPFFVTSCDLQNNSTYWQWDVDPKTRKVRVPQSDLTEIKDLIQSADIIVLQNAKFDVHALVSLDRSFMDVWDWSKVRDTLWSGHLLASNQPHDLTSMAADYLGRNIKPYETRLEEAVKRCRSECRRLPAFKMAMKWMPELPSAEKEIWRNDYWLPRAMAKYRWEMGDPDFEPPVDVIDDNTEVTREGIVVHPWWTVLKEYGNVDSSITLRLWQVHEQLIKERKLEKIYAKRLRLIPIVFGMEDRGVTENKDNLDELTEQYKEESDDLHGLLVGIAHSYGFHLDMPTGASPNDSLREFMFDVLKLEKKKKPKAKTNNPSLSKEILVSYLGELPERSKPLFFIKTLLKKRSRDTALTYLRSYARLGIPVNTKIGKWILVHPNLNPTSTKTLRCTSDTPNSQNIKKREMEEEDKSKAKSLRYCFGPEPGFEWWSFDYENLELRIPAYDAGEQAMIDLFERPNDPPYFGSNHLLAAHILHPQMFEECKDDNGAIDGRIFKKKYDSTWYSWTKNGNFAVQYGAQESSGTADRAYHVQGAQHKIMTRLGKIADLNHRMILHANKYGYVETMPDKNIDPHRGYPMLCTQTEWGGIKPTIPLSYRVQGTAMLCTCNAMDRVEEYFKRLNRFCRNQWYTLVMQVHDELVVRMPAGGNKNLPYVKEIKRLMELSGDDIGVPLRVSVKYHPNNWSDSEPYQ